MLERIPSKIFQQSLNAHFDSINSKQFFAYEAKLSAYEGWSLPSGNLKLQSKLTGTSTFSYLT
jgi:hypothetical protein